MIDLSSNVKLENRYGTWYEIDRGKASDGNEYILFESEQYGNDVGSVLYRVPKDSEIKRIVGAKTGKEFYMIPEEFEMVETFDNLEDTLSDLDLELVQEESLTEDADNKPVDTELQVTGSKYQSLQDAIEDYLDVDCPQDSWFNGSFGWDESFVEYPLDDYVSLVFYGPDRYTLEINWRWETWSDPGEYPSGAGGSPLPSYRYAEVESYKPIKESDLDYTFIVPTIVGKRNSFTEISEEDVLKYFRTTKEELDKVIQMVKPYAVKEMNVAVKRYIEEVQPDEDDY